MEYFRENHVAVYGTPDQVVEQIRSLYRKSGGFGHLIAMLHSGDMDYRTTAKSMTLFAKEVAPQLRELGTVSDTFGPLADKGRPIPAAKAGNRTQALAAMVERMKTAPKAKAKKGRKAA